MISKELFDSTIASANARTDEKLAAAKKKADERFAAVENALARLDENVASLVTWQKAIMAFLTLLLAIYGGLFIAMAKGFHWF